MQALAQLTEKSESASKAEQALSDTLPKVLASKTLEGTSAEQAVAFWGLYPWWMGAY